MYSAVPEATVEELYNCYGGVARYVLQRPFENPSWGLPRLLQPLTRILATCNVQQVRAAMDAIDMGPEASHRLVHIVPYDNFKEKRLTFASDWVAEEFTKRAWIDEQDQEMDKEAAEVLYMPFWEHKELLDCHSKMYSAVPEATVEELYNCYGGVARYVLQRPFENPSWGLPRLLQPLTRILATCNVQQVRAAMDAIDMGPEASHRLVHIVPYDNFKEKRLTFASDWVAEEFTKRAWIDEQDQVKSLMEYSAEAVKGILFEKVMHGVLAMGGKFDVVPLHPETLERGEEEELDIQACTESLRFTDDEASDMMSSIKNMYLRPVSGNFPVIDALKVPEMHLFQMTISRSKVLNADELENVLKRLGIPAPGQEGCQPSLYFVVHPGVYNKFKEKARDVLGEAALGGQASVHLGASRVSCPPVFDRGRLSIEVSTIAGRITGVVPVGGVRTGPCRPRACAGAGVTWRYWRTVESLFCKADSAGWLGGAGGSPSMSSGSARGWCGFFVVVLHTTVRTDK
ncbi:hypothetical protein VOLCADRAFT_108167 [Volvox carteri f. nagariensis]|uniref:Uncharacterized protein n=1 Tax=Volvox carteri f. nagariensis TaxID=3068 RepID=D8UIP5_VOLCA|nr:uncharacterized protein VOLCADRAFT_108167 [Volvox carteri f. nagariensis]EFJ40377.1 hypothetical protein VOLCADRAFT_108167 [Volvox carteri f. nagariensis]|eukprot:XP_002958528.1 hypothetical protein VOLCADRAFT_108167 [Volvox carteri f. nagariensis]